MLYDGSRVAIRNLLKSPEYNNARADVLHYEASKGRYALKLIHPAFGGKCLLLKADNIEFLHVSLPQHLSDAQRELGAKSIKFVETEEFGKALAATADFAVGDVLFYDSPFMVVSNPEGHEKWMVRWDCVYEQVSAPIVPAPVCVPSVLCAPCRAATGACLQRAMMVRRSAVAVQRTGLGRPQTRHTPPRCAPV